MMLHLHRQCKAGECFVSEIVMHRHAWCCLGWGWDEWAGVTWRSCWRLSLLHLLYCQNEPLNSAEWLNSSRSLSMSLSLSLPPVSALPERERERERKRNAAMFSKSSVCSLIKCTQTFSINALLSFRGTIYSVLFNPHSVFTYRILIQRLKMLLWNNFVKLHSQTYLMMSHSITYEYFGNTLF